MSSIGTGYDLSCTTFSPDGRIFQVEYAGKAVENSGTCIAVKCKDGIVFGVERLVTSKLLVPKSNIRTQTVDKLFGVVCAGLVPDGKRIGQIVRSEASKHRMLHQQPMTPRQITERLSMYMHAYTLYSYVRPFGSSVLIGGYKKDTPELYMVEPSGVYWGFHGCAIGKGKEVAKSDIEKLKLQEITCREAVREVAKIIYNVHDPVKDKEFELELSWISVESNKEHVMVPSDVFMDAEKYAKESLEEDDDDDDDEMEED